MECLFLLEPFPVTERVASGVSTGADAAKKLCRPMFLLWAFCMMLTAATELAPQGMQSLVLEKTAGMNGTTILIYTSSMMFVLRHFAGPIAHRLSPVGMLTGSAVLSAIGLYALSFAYDFTTAIAAATIFGLGITYFWPTMLGVTAERFPRGGAFLLGLMGFVGNLSIAMVQPWMGRINDQITFAAIPAEFQNQIVVQGRHRPGQGQEPAARATNDRHRSSEGRGEVVVPLRLGLARDSRDHLRRHRRDGPGSRRIQAGNSRQRRTDARGACLGLLVRHDRSPDRAGIADLLAFATIAE